MTDIVQLLHALSETARPVCVCVCVCVERGSSWQLNFKT